MQSVDNLLEHICTRVGKEIMVWEHPIHKGNEVLGGIFIGIL